MPVYGKVMQQVIQFRPGSADPQGVFGELENLPRPHRKLNSGAGSWLTGFASPARQQQRGRAFDAATFPVVDFLARSIRPRRQFRRGAVFS
jgi:hypothetical protein